MSKLRAKRLDCVGALRRLGKDDIIASETGKGPGKLYAIISIFMRREQESKKL